MRGTAWIKETAPYLLFLKVCGLFCGSVWLCSVAYSELLPTVAAPSSVRWKSRPYSVHSLPMC